MIATRDAIHEEIAKKTSLLTELILKSRVRYSFPHMFLKASGRDHTLRMKVLEFVDVLPSLRNTHEVYERFEMLIGPHLGMLPLVLRNGVYLLRVPVFRAIGIRIMLWLIYNKLAPHFIVGDESALLSLEKSYKKNGARMSVDFLGELVTSQREANSFFATYCSAIARRGHDKSQFNIAIKFSSLYPFFGPENYKESKVRVSDLFLLILRAARKNNTFVTVDAEYYAFSRMVEDIFCDVVSSEECRGMENVGIALQVYRKDALASARRFAEIGKTRGAPFTVRLVKGAYWDTEIAISQQNNWTFPLFQKKDETDRNFEHVFSFLLSHWGDVYVSPATHNPESMAYASCHALKRGVLSDKNFMFQVLYGLGDPIRRALYQCNLPVLVYTPVGDLVKGMSYFTRRILENTSNEGFLFQLLD